MLRDLADEVRPAALDFARRRQVLVTDVKGERDFVSDADRQLEEVILAALHDMIGPVAVIGEEGGGTLDERSSGWAVDPLDGTSNFLRGLPLWGVSVGRLEEGDPDAGLLIFPELGVTLTAVRGSGAQLNGTPLKLDRRRHPARTFALGENNVEELSRTDERAVRLRAEGYDVVRYRCATFGLAGVAMGWLDGYLEHGCGLWDAAAGAVICREAGAAVSLRSVGEATVGMTRSWFVEARRPD